jgi:hypothetical protein
VNPKFASPDQLEVMKQAKTVKSANVTCKAILKGIGKLVFRKNTKPAVARLETVVAEFFRHTLGKNRTAHGKVIVDNGKIVGSYVEAIPGFLSMKDLMGLAKQPGKLTEEIEKLEKEVADVRTKIAGGNKDIYLAASLLKKESDLGTYQSIQSLKLIDEKLGEVNLSKISGLLSQALCTAFFYEDWDRHKDNFGLSFANGKLGIASLDYDKSLNGSFPTSLQNYNWDVTPQRLRDFPVFKCWFWPTGSKSISAFIKSPEKEPKMYTSGEVKQYSDFKDNPEFKRQAMVEWLKLAFIPKEIRQDAVTKLAGSDCDPKLRAVPDRLESKRKTMIDSLVQLNNFRKEFNRGENQNKKGILTDAKKELIISLDVKEFQTVNKHWDDIQDEIEAKVEAVNKLEATARKLGHSQLLAAIDKTGISFSSTLSEERLKSTLDKIATIGAPREIAKVLNKECGLDISEADARKIKQENYLNRICEKMPMSLAKKLREEFVKGNIEIKKRSFPKDETLEAIARFEKMVKACQYKKGEELTVKFDDVMKSLRSLGVEKKVVSDDVLRASWQGTISLPPIPKTKESTVMSESRPRLGG